MPLPPHRDKRRVGSPRYIFFFSSSCSSLVLSDLLSVSSLFLSAVLYFNPHSTVRAYEYTGPGAHLRGPIFRVRVSPARIPPLSSPLIFRPSSPVVVPFRQDEVCESTVWLLVQDKDILRGFWLLELPSAIRGHFLRIIDKAPLAPTSTPRCSSHPFWKRQPTVVLPPACAPSSTDCAGATSLHHASSPGPAIRCFSAFLIRIYIFIPS